ncbi:hypothetical protein ABT121_04660 [Streptomyces sp. NPDC001928]|uniref:hypothetical protein n=1 Tax=Streptomyces sp. NPDC001928 TaxID=3154404 RepID=UPI00331784E9
MPGTGERAGPHDWSPTISTNPHPKTSRRCRRAPGQRRLSRHLSRTALTALVRGAATAIGAVAAGGLLAWLREHI